MRHRTTTDRPRHRRRRVGLFAGATAALGLAVGGGVQPVHAALRATVTAPPTLAARLAAIHEVSYWPGDDMGPDMWQVWQPAEIDRDFGRAASLGVTTVRVIIPPSAFGWPTPLAAMQSHLADVLTMAAAHGLTVQLTLFDHWSAFWDQADTNAWIAQVLGPYAGDPRLAFVELQNEVGVANASQMGWVAATLPVLRQTLGPLVPVTVSLPGSATAATLQTLQSELASSPPDFYDVHYYGAPELAQAALAADQAVVAPTPLYVGETGAPSADTTNPASDPVWQAQYIGLVEQACQRLGLPDASVWTLNDFTSQFNPGARQSAENSMGLIDLSGAVKPAGRVVAGTFTTGAVPQVLDGTFDTGVAGWQAWATPSSTVGWTSSTGHGAPGAAVLSGTVANPLGVPGLVTTPVTQPSGAGQVMRLSAWARTVANTGTVTSSIAWYDANRKWLGTTTSPAMPHGTTGWLQLVAQGAAPAGTAYARISLNSWADPGTVYFDDVTFTPVG